MHTLTSIHQFNMIDPDARNENLATYRTISTHRAQHALPRKEKSRMRSGKFPSEMYRNPVKCQSVQLNCKL